MTTCLGKSCSFGLPRVPFVNCCQFMYLVISLLVLRTGCGIWLYRFLIIAYLFNFKPVTPELFFPTQPSQYCRFAKPNDLRKAYTCIKAEHVFSHMGPKYSEKRSFINIATKLWEQRVDSVWQSLFMRDKGMCDIFRLSETLFPNISVERLQYIAVSDRGIRVLFWFRFLDEHRFSLCLYFSWKERKGQ